MKNKPIAFIRELLKDKNEEEILETKHNFREYLRVMWDIFQRLEGGDPEDTLDFMGENDETWDKKE